MRALESFSFEGNCGTVIGTSFFTPAGFLVEVEYHPQDFYVVWKHSRGHTFATWLECFCFVIAG